MVQSVEPAVRLARAGASRFANGLGGAGPTRYLWRCTGDRSVPAMTTWIRKTAEGDKEVDGGRRRRIARRATQGDHRAADRQGQGGRGAGPGEPLRRSGPEH